MVFKSTVFVFCALLGVSVAQYEYNGFQNNLVEYDVPVPVHLNTGIGLPYPYQEIRPVYGPLTVPAPPPPAPVPTAIVASKLGLIGSIISNGISFIHSAISFFITKIPAIFIGVLTSLGFCKFTHICTKLSSIQSIQQIEEDFISFATPERITRAAEFVQEAVKKYAKLNKA